MKEIKSLRESINQLMNAIDVLAYYIPSNEDKNNVKECLLKCQTALYSSSDVRDELIDIIDSVVDANQTLNAENIADAILEAGLAIDKTKIIL